MSRLRLFWCKIILGNHFIPHCMFGCAWKIEFFRKQFHLTVNICFTFLFSLQTIFRLRLTKRERERERDRAPTPDMSARSRRWDRPVEIVASSSGSDHRRPLDQIALSRSRCPPLADLLSLFDLWFFCCCYGGVLVVFVLCGGGFCVDSGEFSVSGGGFSNIKFIWKLRKWLRKCEKFVGK